jgi:hypothetical protein
MSGARGIGRVGVLLAASYNTLLSVYIPSGCGRRLRSSCCVSVPGMDVLQTVLCN